MGLRSISGKLFAAAAALLLVALYLGNLSTMGLILPDEPRYADIGRAMARTGDWITPRLWGQPWFEKPVLLYWMTGVGFRLGLGPELAPRLPVALLGLGFLVFFWFRLRRLWDVETACAATAMLATSVGWLAYSHVAITDIPLAVLFSSAVLLSLDPEAVPYTRIAAILGLATLAKSLLPLVLFLPVPALQYRRLAAWLRPGPVAAFLAISLPWHILCAKANGFEFVRVLFIEHQLGRFSSSALQHVQPWWFYVPAMLLLLFPWFPLLPLIPRDFRDPKTRTLLSVVIFGFVFLSAAVNKLPSYVLPLLPSTCALIGVGVARQTRRGVLPAVPLALLALLPPAARLLPQALSTGIRSANVELAPFLWWLAGGAAVAALAWFLLSGRGVVVPVAGMAGAAFLWLQITVFPAIDHAASGRGLWLSQHPVCAPVLRRTVLYSLNYYAGRDLPACARLDPAPAHVVR